jgi:hypothetical protein
VVNLATGINLSTYKEVGTRKYLISNNSIIWNWLAIEKRIKIEKMKIQQYLHWLNFI